MGGGLVALALVDVFEAGFEGRTPVGPVVGAVAYAVLVGDAFFSHQDVQLRIAAVEEVVIAAVDVEFNLFALVLGHVFNQFEDGVGVPVV